MANQNQRRTREWQFRTPNLEMGSVLVGTYRKMRYECHVEDDEGLLAFIISDGRRFKSASAAASAVMGGKAVNGWLFWSVAEPEPVERITANLHREPAEAEQPLHLRTARHSVSSFRALRASTLLIDNDTCWRIYKCSILPSGKELSSVPQQIQKKGEGNLGKRRTFCNSPWGSSSPHEIRTYAEYATKEQQYVRKAVRTRAVLMNSREETKVFHLGDILSITTKTLLSPRYFHGVYDVVGYLTYSAPPLDDLEQAMERCRGYILQEHPQLRDMDVGSVEFENWREWLQVQTEQYGEWIALRRPGPGAL